MAGYEPKGKIEPDPEKQHTCVHENRTHPCQCALGVEHTFDQWIDHFSSLHPADTSGDR